MQIEIKGYGYSYIDLYAILKETYNKIQKDGKLTEYVKEYTGYTIEEIEYMIWLLYKKKEIKEIAVRGYAESIKKSVAITEACKKLREYIERDYSDDIGKDTNKSIENAISTVAMEDKIIDWLEGNKYKKVVEAIGILFRKCGGKLDKETLQKWRILVDG